MAVAISSGFGGAVSMSRSSSASGIFAVSVGEVG